MKRRAPLVLALSALLLAACTPPSPDSSPLPTVDAQPGTTPEPSPSAPEESLPVEAEPAVPTAGEVAAIYEDAVPAEWGLEVSGVLTGTDGEGIALTLDACGGPYGNGYDEALIEGLIERGVPATLFFNQRWIEENFALAKVLADNPLFEIANHGTEHRPLSVTGQDAYGIGGTASALEAAEEVRGNHVTITELTGEPPRFFRSGTAHYDEVAVRIAEGFDEQVLGFTINGDGGATFDAATVRAEVMRARAGDVVIAHMNQPGGGTAEGLLAAVDELTAGGAIFTFVDDPGAE